MKHGAKRPNPVRTNVPPKPTDFFVANPIVELPSLVEGQPPRRMLALKKGRTYKNPENKDRLRGKPALRDAKAARVHGRKMAFVKECMARNVSFVGFNDRCARDRIQNQWRTEK